jgi:hypothetical protein
MKKIATLGIVGSLVAGGFLAGMAVGKGAADVKFVAAEEVKGVELMPGGPSLGGLWGDPMKGPFGGLLKLKAGFTSPLHTHSGDYEAVQISGTSSHWLKGEDGTKAKKMTPGSYWKMPGKLPHVSACAAGADCVMYIVQKSKFDFAAVPEDKTATAKPADAKATTTTTVTTAKPADAKATTTTTTTTTAKPVDAKATTTTTTTAKPVDAKATTTTTTTAKPADAKATTTTTTTTTTPAKK